MQICAEKINSEGGILGRKVELLMEEETTPKETLEKFKKLTIQEKAEVVLGLISTANGLAVGPAAEELKQLWLSWDATTEKGVARINCPMQSIHFEPSTIAGDNLPRW